MPQLLQPCTISLQAWTLVILLDVAAAWMWDKQSHNVAQGSSSHVTLRDTCDNMWYYEIEVGLYCI